MHPHPVGVLEASAGESVVHGRSTPKSEAGGRVQNAALVLTTPLVGSTITAPAAQSFPR
jgi:hypothetical protein